MSNIFVISDTHFGHANILGFKDKHGNLIRPGFGDVYHMNEVMVENWNSVVRPHDKVYHLGDVVMAGQDLSILDRLNGHKRLIRGNHDMQDTKAYLKYFDEVYGCRVLDRMIFTHIPIHNESVERFIGNVHGHIHQNIIPHPRYLNVSVEAVNYTPIDLMECRKRIETQIERG